MLNILGLDHVVLRAVDVERMRRFYCEVLGCLPDKENARFGLYHLRAGRTMIDLVDVAGELGRRGGAPPGAGARNMDHLCLRVEPFDPAAILAHLAAHGATADAPVMRYGAEGDGLSIYVRDPEGNTVELKGPAVA